MIRLFAFSAAGVVLLMMAAPLLLPQATLNAMLIDAVAERGIQLESREVSLRLLPLPQLTVRDLSIESGRFKSAAVTARLALHSLLQGRLTFDSIEVGPGMVRLDQQGERIVHFSSGRGGIQFGDDGTLHVDVWHVALYRGDMELNGKVRPDKQLSGSVKLSGIDTTPLLADLHSPHQFSGTLAAELAVSGTLSAPEFNGPAEIRSGKVALGGIIAGYDLLRFQLLATAAVQQLKAVEFYSPLLNANGALLIDHVGRLNGHLQTGGLLRGKFRVGGDIVHPQLFPIAAVQH